MQKLTQGRMLTFQYLCASDCQAAPTASLTCNYSSCALTLAQMREALLLTGAREAEIFLQHLQHTVSTQIILA